ncbi:MAG: TetR/AcrR family transcriptional regulator [Syntrophales bacterium]
MKITDTRKKILEAGLKIFSSKGYAGATTKEIAAKAGVAEVTVFRYFSSKERLFEEVMNAYSFLPALKELLPELEGIDYRDALFIIAERFLGLFSERKELIRIIHSEIYRSPRIALFFRKFVEEIFRAMASYFTRMDRRGELRKFNPEYAARAFLGMFMAFFVTEEFIIKRISSKEEKKRIIEEFVEIFARGTIRDK